MMDGATQLTQCSGNGEDVRLLQNMSLCCDVAQRVQINNTL